MINKDILGIIRGDVKRNKKPKKQLDDFLIGEDEVFEESLKRKSKVSVDLDDLDDLDAPIGESHGEDKKAKPKLELMDFGKLNKMQAKEQIRELKKVYLTLYETLEDVTEELAEEKNEKSEIQIKLEYLKKEQKELKRVFRETLNYFPDAFELKVELDSTDWKINSIENKYLEKLNNLKNSVKDSTSKIEDEQYKAEEQKKILIQEIEETREYVVKVEREKFDLRNEIKKMSSELEKISALYEEEKTKVKEVYIETKTEERYKEEKVEEKVEEEYFEFQKESAREKEYETDETDEDDELDLSELMSELEEIEVPEIVEETIEPKREEKPRHEEKPKHEPKREEKPRHEEKPKHEPKYEEKPRHEEKPKHEPKREEVKEIVKPVMKFEKDVDEPVFEMPKFKDLSVLEKVEIKREESPNYLFISVEKYLEGLNDYGKMLIKIIGKTGVERNNELLKVLEEDEESKKLFFQNDKLLKNEFNNSLKNLRDRQFLESTQLKLGSKGGYDFMVYKLTDIGQAVYYKLTNEKPTESAMEKVLSNHASLEHGYLIKETAIAFREMGYEVLEERADCTYDVGGGNRKVFDLIVIDKDGKKMHIEVERGTHNNQDFSNMMDKIYAVVNEIYFVAPNETILYKNVKGKVFSWLTNKLGGFENAKGKIKFNFTTFEKIKQKKTKIWEKYEP